MQHPTFLPEALVGRKLGGLEEKLRSQLS